MENFENTIMRGEAAETLAKVPAGSVDLVVTDPPYLVNYCDRDGRSLCNDDNPDGVLPVFPAMARVMKRHSYRSFYPQHIGPFVLKFPLRSRNLV